MATGNRMTALYITEAGLGRAEALREIYPDLMTQRYESGSFEAVWAASSAIIFIMAAGIAVRAIAPHIKDKASDPAVLVMDDNGNNIISLLSGHEGGANRMAEEIAAGTGASPVITTATDNAGLSSIDLFAKKNSLTIEDRSMLPGTSSRHLAEKTLKIYSDIPLVFPDDYISTDSPAEADVVISHRIIETRALVLRPRNLVLGMGLNTGTMIEEIRDGVKAFMHDNGYCPLSLRGIVTHEKKLSERGLREYARLSGLPLRGLTTEELNSVKGVEQSDAARRALGVQAVAEPAALLASGAGELLVKKVRSGNLTMALCRRPEMNSGTLRIVGTGPGGLDYMAPRALAALRDADAIVGYKTYLGQIERIIKGKEVIATGMTQEVARARAAVEEALKGRSVAVISGGDPGVYAMAGLVFEVMKSMETGTLDVEIIPGISALNACASRLGAPLMHDFAAISLSDRLTPWDLIEKRIEAAASADMVIALYNPKSKGRATHIDRAREIIMGHRPASTPVGIVRGATRENEDTALTTLEHMLDFDIDMQSTVIIGNSRSFSWRGWFVTPRGYSDKYDV